MYLVDTDVISNARKRIRVNPVTHYQPTGVAVLDPFT
jgi:hypothetical protein